MIKKFNLYLILLTSIVVFALQNKSLIIILTFIFSLFVLKNIAYAGLNKKNLIIAIAFIITLIPAIINSYYDAGALYYFVQSLVILLLSIIIVKKYDINEIIKCTRAIYFFLALIIYLGIYKYKDEHEPLSYLIDGSSTNGITSYIIIFQIFYSSLYFIKFTQLPIYSALNTVIISVVGYGRGSIIISLMLLALSLFVNFIYLNNVKFLKKISIIIILLICATIVFSNWSDVVNFFELYTKLGNGVVDEARAEIFDSYVDNLDYTSFIFGSDYINTIIYTLYSSNPHISFIRTHHTFGLFFTLIVLLSPIIFFKIENNKFNAFILSLLSTLSLLRAASEPILFPTILDLYYIIPFIIVLGRRNYVSISNG